MFQNDTAIVSKISNLRGRRAAIQESKAEGKEKNVRRYKEIVGSNTLAS
jgi:hypothetical protein